VRKACLVLLAAVAAVLAGNLDAVLAVPDEVAVPYSEDVTRQPNAAPSEDGGFIVGTIDTVGGTTYDWGANGPMNRMIVNSPGHGIHVLWMYSQSTTGTAFPDRNMRYNYYDYSAGSWSWIDPDYMTSGVNVYTDRSGFGNLQADSAGAAVVSGHQGSAPIVPVLAKDFEAGAGFFEYSTGPTCVWPALAIGQNGYMHIGTMDNSPATALLYTRCAAWDDWDTPVNFDALSFSDQVIDASKVSDKVCVAWVPDGATPTGGKYRVSTDAGTTWESVQTLSAPPTFGGDTIPSFWICGFSPFYDKFDKLHIVAAVEPTVGGSGYVIPAEIWHWSPDNSPAWSRIQHAYGEIQSPIGYNAVLACRPSIGEDEDGGLYVAWEQFDPYNVEAGPPERLRADIYYAQDNGDHGQTWQAPVKITDTDETTKRFPSIIDKVTDDTLRILYIQDLHAGFFLYSEGDATNNPIIVHKVPITTGVKEGRRPVLVEDLAVRPNPSTGRARMLYTLPVACRVELSVFDLAGREVATLCDRHQAAGQYSAAWNAAGLTSGIYIARLKAGEKMLTQKIVLQ